MSDLAVLLAIVAALAAGVALWAILRLRRLQGSMVGLRQRLALLDAEVTRAGRLEEEMAGMRDERTASAARIAALETEGREQARYAEQRVADMEATRAQMTAQFDALAGQAIRVQGEDFRKAATAQLGAIVAPLASDIGKFQSEIRNAHQGALAERAALREQLGTLTRRSEAVSREAESLTRALRGDTQMQGAWGEAVLGRLLETSGLREGHEYETQGSVRTEEGRLLRPDVVVHLPGGRDMVVDSKVSLVAYERAVNSDDEAVCAEAIADHVASLRAHVKGLSGKEYANVVGGTADYVILFVPIEGALSEALRAKPDLTEYAAALQVMIATPTTLMMALRTVKTVWDVENRNANAERIAERAGKLYDKMVGFATDMEKVGRQLDSARDAHSAAVGKLTDGSGNLVRQVEMLKALGARTSKEMPASLKIEAEGE